MLTDDAHDTDPHVAPTCRQCGSSLQVRPVPMDGLDPGVQYWRCDQCGLVWATRDGNPSAIDVV
jgi:hypothetical protein